MFCENTGSAAPGCDINPPQRLIITEGEPSMLTCYSAVPCQNVINTYFYTPDAQDASRINVVGANIFDDIHSNVNRTEDQTNTHCLYSLDLYWTRDERIRSQLVSLQCVFVFGGGASPCTTKKVSVVFAGMNKLTIYCNQLGVNYKPPCHKL